jgi:hypothetical protein
VASAARDDWFRSPVWDGQIEAAFEQRLRRARPYHQPQYLRIQATHRLSSPDPRVREAGGAASARDHQVPDDPAVRQLARQALAVATETAPALARHPDVGRPRASDADIADLEQLTAAT